MIFLLYIPWAASCQTQRHVNPQKSRKRVGLPSKTYQYQLRTDMLSVYFYMLSSTLPTHHHQLLSLPFHRLKSLPEVPYCCLSLRPSKSYLTRMQNYECKLLDIGMVESGGEGHGFFVHNQLVKVCAGLNRFALSIESDKASLLRTLKESASSFPPEFVSYCILPCFASAATVIPLVLQFRKERRTRRLWSVVVAPLIRLFASADCGTCIALLDSLPNFAEKLDKTVVDKIWPNLQTGFTDAVAVIQEATVRAIILLSSQVIQLYTQQRTPPLPHPPPIRPGSIHPHQHMYSHQPAGPFARV